MDFIGGEGLLDTTYGVARGWTTSSTDEGCTWNAYTERGSESGTARDLTEASRLAQEAYQRLIDKGAAC